MDIRLPGREDCSGSIRAQVGPRWLMNGIDVAAADCKKRAPHIRYLLNIFNPSRNIPQQTRQHAYFLQIEGRYVEVAAERTVYRNVESCVYCGICATTVS